MPLSLRGAHAERREARRVSRFFGSFFSKKELLFCKKEAKNFHEKGLFHQVEKPFF
jgi:hypothetical protein